MQVSIDQLLQRFGRPPLKVRPCPLAVLMVNISPHSVCFLQANPYLHMKTNIGLNPHDTLNHKSEQAVVVGRAPHDATVVEFSTNYGAPKTNGKVRSNHEIVGNKKVSLAY